jgi:hypothetical protein
MIVSVPTCCIQSVAFRVFSVVLWCTLSVELLWQVKWAKCNFINAYKEKTYSEEFAEKIWAELVQHATVASDVDGDSKEYFIKESLMHLEGGKTVAQDCEDSYNSSPMNGWPSGSPPLVKGFTQQRALDSAIDACGELLPLESKDLYEYNRIVAETNVIKDSISIEHMDKLAEGVQKQFVLVGQLNQTLRVVVTELKSVASKRKNVMDKKTSEDRERKAAEALKSQKDTAEQEKKRLGKAQKTDSFKLKFEDAGFPPVTCYKGDTSFKDVADDVYNLPFMLTDSDGMKDMMGKGDASQAQQTIQRWLKTLLIPSHARQMTG